MSSRGASPAGLPFMLVGGKTHPKAYATASDFLEFINITL
jgi:hypothetical protein